MGKPKGKTPSLLSISTGKPEVHSCGKLTPCDRCGERVAKGDACFRIPKMKSGFTNRPIFCVECTSDIVTRTKADIVSIEAVLKQYV
jgi:hypothetical protein